jgi:hypothetical protein
MALVQVRSYLSPTLVLLALDWPEGAPLPIASITAAMRTVERACMVPSSKGDQANTAPRRTRPAPPM